MKAHLVKSGEAQVTDLVSKKNQVLIAMLSLETFTAEGLSRYSRVIVPTVRTIMGRNESKLERVGTDPTNQRGGQRIRYRLTDEGRRELRDIINTAREQLRQTEPTFLEKISARLPLGDAMPLGLRLANDTTGRLFGEAATVSEKLELLQLAEGEARGALNEIDETQPAMAQRIEKEVETKLAEIQKQREAIAMPADVPALALQIWSGLPAKSAFKKRLLKDLQIDDVHVSEVPETTATVPEIGDAVVLLVDSGNVKKARLQFDRAVKISHEVNKPLAVLDTGYDQGFRKHVYGSGVPTYCPDAASLDANSTRFVISGAVQSPSDAGRAVQPEPPRMTQTPTLAGSAYLRPPD